MKSKFKEPSLDEVITNGERIGLSRRECERFYAYFETIGWVVGRSSKPMKCFKGAMITWKMNGEDKKEAKSIMSPSMTALLDRERLGRIEERLKFLRGQQPFRATSKMADEFSKLKQERIKVMQALNFIA